MVCFFGLPALVFHPIRYCPENVVGTVRHCAGNDVIVVLAAPTVGFDPGPHDVEIRIDGADLDYAAAVFDGGLSVQHRIALARGPPIPFGLRHLANSQTENEFVANRQEQVAVLDLLPSIYCGVEDFFACLPQET